MDMIAAVDRNLGIGREGSLLVRIPEDMQNFRRTTQGAAVILGHNTLRTFPGGRPLVGRENVVLSRDPALRIEGARVCHSAREALDIAREYEDASRYVFVIGGAQVYAQLAPYCTGAVLTELDAVFPADSTFPDLYAAGWRRTQTLGEGCHDGLRFVFARYENPRPLAF